MRGLGTGGADLEIAISHDTQPVAVATEGLGHRGDEGNRASEAGYPEILCHLSTRVLHNAKQDAPSGIMSWDLLRATSLKS